MPQRDFQAGDRGLGLGQRAVGLVDVELGRGAGFEAGFDDRKRFLLQLDVVLSVDDLLLRGADVGIVGGDVAQQRHQRGVVVFDRGVEVILIGFDGPAESAPKVELPVQVEAVAPLAEEPLGKELGVGWFPC